MMTRSGVPTARLLFALVLLVAALLGGLKREASQAAAFVQDYGYLFTLVAAGLFLVYITIWVVRSQWRPQPTVILLGLVAVMSASVVVFHGSSLDYKILMDDYLLAATAKSLHETGEVAVADFGRGVDGEFLVIHSFVDKRPWFYPFLVSLAHDVLGYDPVHPFATNALMAVVLLAVAFAIGYALTGSGGGFLAVLLWASLPLLQQNATGAGMEMANLLWLHIVILLAICYLRSPSAAGEGALCLSGVLLTYSRYESGLFLGAILAVIVLGWRRRKQVFLSLPAVCAAPLLLAAVVQTRIYVATESSWELADGVGAPFSITHFWANVPHAVAFFLSRDLAIANSFWLGIWALPAIVGFLAICWRRRFGDWWSRAANQVWIIFFVFLLLSVVVVLCFHASQFDKRYVARYSLPAHLLIIFSAVACLGAWPWRKWLLGAAVAFTALWIVLFTWPKNGQALYTKANFMIAEQHWLETLEARYLSTDTLVIDRFNVAWTLRERAALPPHVALLSAERLKAELAAGKYDQILLVERASDVDGVFQSQLPAVSALLDGFAVERLAAKSFREGTLTRLYRLAAVPAERPSEASLQAQN